MHSNRQTGLESFCRGYVSSIATFARERPDRFQHDCRFIFFHLLHHENVITFNEILEFIFHCFGAPCWVSPLLGAPNPIGTGRTHDSRHISYP